MAYTPTGSLEIIAEEDYNSKIEYITKIFDEKMCKGYFNSYDGTRIYYEFMKTENARASIVFVHGYTEFLKKYYELCWYFINLGYNVFMYDARGHGLSQRLVPDTEVTHVNNYNDYAGDLNSFITEIVQKHSDKAPIHLFSHSLGGAVSLLYLSKFNSPVKKTILSAPMIYPVCVSLPRFVLMKLVENEARKFGWDNRFKFSSHFNPYAKVETSNDESAPRFYYNLKLRIDEPRYQNSAGSNRWMHEAIRIKEELLDKKNLKNINSDIFLIIAGKDTVVRTDAQRKLSKKLPCTVRCFENARHSLYTMTGENLKDYILSIAEFLS